MKRLAIIAALAVLLSACNKEKSYLHFTEKQLDFVNYTGGQTLKFIDTANQVQTLTQFRYNRDFRKLVGTYGRTEHYSEEYEVAYHALNSGTLGLGIQLDALNRSLNMEVASYFAIALPDSLRYAFDALTINGVSYRNVYTLKVYKNGQFVNNSDTATLFHNQQYGVIQVLFPDGKRIVRTD